MKADEKKPFFRLQFFGDGDENTNGDGAKETDVNDGSNDGDNSNGGSDGEKGSEKTFTQSEVSKMMAREKSQGKQSVLNALGFKSEKDAKDAVALLKALQDSQKSEQEKADEEKKNALTEKEEAEKRAIMAEAKLSCIVNGVNKESVEDVLTIAMSKVSDDKTLDDVISEMKKEKKYSSFFVSESKGDDSDSGTGSAPKGKQGSGSGSSGSSDYGKLLAERFNAQKSGETKSKFF